MEENPENIFLQNNDYNNDNENEDLKIARLNKFLKNSGYMKNIRIFVYSWNINDLNLSKREDDNSTIQNVDDPQYAFFRKMIKKIQKKRCHMVIFNFQNDQSNDIFTKTFLPSIMKEYNYIMPSTAAKSISEFKPKFGTTVLRTIIYVQKMWWKRISMTWWNDYKAKWYEKVVPKNVNKIVEEKMANIQQFNKKCNLMDENLLSQLTVLEIPTYGKLGIINTNFRGNEDIFIKLNELMQKKIKEYRNERKWMTRNLTEKDIYPLYESVYEMTRQKIIQEQSKCLNQMITKAKEEGVEYLILSGNLNYRVKLTSKFKSIPKLLESFQYQYSRISRQLLSQYEEITAELASKSIDPLMEGVNNRGVTFPPTCLLRQSRNPDQCKIVRNWNRWNMNEFTTGKMYKSSQYNKDCYLMSNNQNYTPFGWCDRIFYNSYGKNKNKNQNKKDKMKCVYYDSGDVFESVSGNYRPVFAILEID